ncbi:MAG: hypothetical protein BWY11_00528 [Firmicutes bacterium ADurb.Bin182]|nr:MAG: hypothetical protein BWY11_00528 [Firmicutes bacterium ADurb.Bin182]
MRIIARFEKGGHARFLSHLDVLRMFHRAFRRAGIPISYSEGFNPHPLLSFAAALAVGYTSESEWLDAKLERDIEISEFMRSLNDSLPCGFRLTQCFAAEERLPSLTKLMCAAEYIISLSYNEREFPSKLETAAEKLMSNNIFVKKRSKSGFKIVDIRPLVYDIHVETLGEGEIALSVTGCLNSSESLNIGLLLDSLFQIAGKPETVFVHRRRIYSDDGTILPKFGG